MIDLSYTGVSDSKLYFELPVSKSVMNRELILAAVAGSLPKSLAAGLADDIGILYHALSSNLKIIDLHHAGTAMRFSTAYFSTLSSKYILDGSSRMRERPIDILVEALRALGAEIDYLREPGYPPIEIRGGSLQGGQLAISGEVSSQYISALLLIATAMPKGLELSLIPPVVSRPYIDLTLSILEKHGVRYSRNEDQISIPHQPIIFRHIEQERDWSAAAFAYGLVAQGAPAKLFLPHLSLDSAQGDRAVADQYQLLGVETTETPSGIIIKRASQASGHIALDMTRTPDLAQAMVMTCAALGTSCHLTGLSTLRIKETDRLAALKESLSQVGIEADTGADFIRFTGKIDPKARPSFMTYQDHRMAMSQALLSPALSAIEIQNEDVVSKSFPGFWRVLQEVGFTIK